MIFKAFVKLFENSLSKFLFQKICWFLKNRGSKIIFFGAKEFLTWTLISKMAVKINLRIITKNHAADPEKGFLTKSISKPYGRATAMPPAWE